MHRLEVAHDRWSLSEHEEGLHQFAKLRLLGLSSLQRTIA
jgi:hypothetical protein